MGRLVLASASPRRRRLLSEAGFEFEVLVSGVDESHDLEKEPEEVAVELARRKAVAVAEDCRGGDVLCLGADTVVAIPGGERWSFLGKPADAAEAREMLGHLSGTKHAVVTGVCVVRSRDMASFEGSERTMVEMREITPAEIEAYVDSGEWEDKAGGYAIQETADAFVAALEGGGFDNVVGLPVELARGLLTAASG
ncbi:MAG: Maf family protein [Planctomycetes bacterium]|nr:Maf family protein [Planctomycetota bacterium]